MAFARLALLALALAAAAAPAAVSALVLDGHVHISNLSFTYPWSVPCPDTPCPAAPLCLCEWTPADYTAATTRLPADRFVFVEVAVAAAQWLAEAAWVQALADAGESRVGAIIAQPPPGFGVPGADPAALGAALDRLAALPLARGVRISAVDFTDAGVVPTVIAHVALLAARNLTSIDIIMGGVGALPAAAANLAAVAAASPSVTFILDHIGSPPYLFANASLQPGWRAAMAALGAVPNFVCKVGGVLQGYKSTGSIPGVDTVRPFVEHALRSFGYEKSLYEGNWFFVNWLVPAELDNYNLFAGYLNDILLGMGATEADRANYYWATGARAYRVAAP